MNDKMQELKRIFFGFFVLVINIRKVKIKYIKYIKFLLYTKASPPVLNIKNATKKVSTISLLLIIPIHFSF